MTITREKFADRFGEANAAAVEAAAEQHKNGMHDNPGSDPFKWALLIAIGYECMTKPEFAQHHGIELPVEPVVKAWVRQHADLGSHDGDFDSLCAIVGGYDGWVNEPLSADAATWTPEGADR